MSVLVGIGADGRGIGGVHLAGRIADSLHTPVTICCVVPQTWSSPALPRGIDDDYARHLHELARSAIEEARAVLPSSVASTNEVRLGRSVPRELMAAAADTAAEIIVVGSSHDALLGHVSIGTVSERLMHSATTPIAMAPRSFWSAEGDRVERLVLGISPEPDCDLGPAIEQAKRFGVGIWLVTFGVRRLPALPDGGGRQADQDVLDAWLADMQRVHDRVGADAANAGVEVLGSDLVIADSWRRAVEKVHWIEGDLLVVGSGTGGPLSRVFLGSTASRIMTSSPVPVLVLPR